MKKLWFLCLASFCMMNIPNSFAQGSKPKHKWEITAFDEEAARKFGIVYYDKNSVVFDKKNHVAEATVRFNLDPRPYHFSKDYIEGKSRFDCSNKKISYSMELFKDNKPTGAGQDDEFGNKNPFSKPGDKQEGIYDVYEKLCSQLESSPR